MITVWKRKDSVKKASSERKVSLQNRERESMELVFVYGAININSKGPKHKMCVGLKNRSLRSRILGYTEINLIE